MLILRRCDMSKGKSNRKTKRRRWTFLLEAKDAQEVLLMGDFNDWSSEKHPMQRDENGIWNKTVMLLPGNYEYKFLVDGQWREDPANDRLRPNRFGTYNSVIELTES
jgi:1,4-alpha-glucan branching enzyme